MLNDSSSESHTSLYRRRISCDQQNFTLTWNVLFNHLLLVVKLRSFHYMGCKIKNIIPTKKIYAIKHQCIPVHDVHYMQHYTSVTEFPSSSPVPFWYKTRYNNRKKKVSSHRFYLRFLDYIFVNIHHHKKKWIKKKVNKRQLLCNFRGRFICRLLFCCIIF